MKKIGILLSASALAFTLGFGVSHIETSKSEAVAVFSKVKDNGLLGFYGRW